MSSNDYSDSFCNSLIDNTMATLQQIVTHYSG